MTGAQTNVVSVVQGTLRYCHWIDNLQISDGRPIMSWADDLKVQTGTDENLRSPNSESGGSSAVHDGGDSGQLQQRRQHGLACSEATNQDQLFKDVGSKFLSPSHHSGEEDTADSTATTLREHSPSPASFESRIRGALQVSSGIQKRRFLPFDKFDQIFTYNSVLEELRTHYKDETQEQLHALARQVFDEVELPKTGYTSRRKIFATLVRIDKAAEITHFIKEGLYDSDLPFYFPSAYEDHKPVYRRTERGEEIPIHCFMVPRWRPFDRETFAQYQWEFQAPFFIVTPTNGRRGRPRHYPLENDTILPFIEDYEGEGRGDMISAGSSEVWRVRIHRAHHSHPSVRHGPQ